MDDLVGRAASTENRAGPGIYLAGAPDSSRKFGERLLIFRVTGPDGKGVSCPEDADFKAVNDQTKGAARSNLQLLVKYDTSGHLDIWFISPRVPDHARGEQVVFDRPHQGDAELAASEMITGKTRLELLNNFYRASGIGELTDLGGYCLEGTNNASGAFYKKYLCQSLPERLAQALASLPHQPLTPAEKLVLNEIAAGNTNSQINSAALDSILKNIEP